MSLKYALLGFLSTEPTSGYEMTREFGEALGWYWQASQSQIYPELRKLESAGLVAADVSNDNPGKPKRTYRLTEAGEAELRAWLERPTEYPPTRDAERVKLMFLDLAPLDVIRGHLEAHHKHHEQLLTVYTGQLREIRQGVFRRLVKRLGARRPEEHALITGLKVLAVQGNIARARTEVHWAEDALSWLDSMERS